MLKKNPVVTAKFNFIFVGNRPIVQDLRNLKNKIYKSKSPTPILITYQLISSIILHYITTQNKNTELLLLCYLGPERRTADK